jgi:hypothetical protein
MGHAAIEVNDASDMESDDYECVCHRRSFQTNSRSGPLFTKGGDLVLPTAFREWAFVGAHYAKQSE